MSGFLLQHRERVSWLCGRRRMLLLGGIGLFLLTLAAYYPAMARGGFIWDDDLLLLKHDAILSQNPLAAFWDRESADFFPLTTISFWLEYGFFGDHPRGYHVVNVVLHAGGAVLFWLVLRRLKVPGAFGAALLYAVHPVTVESVAWIAERKNTLSQLLFFASLERYLAFEDQANGGNEVRLGAWRTYGGSLVLFVLGLLAKTSIVMLPLMLLLLAWYRRGRIALTDLLRVGPFVVFSAVLGVVTLYMQHAATAIIAQLHATLPGFAMRSVEAGWGYWFYLGKCLWPWPVMMVYPGFRLSHSWMDVLPLVGIPVVFIVVGAMLVERGWRWPRAVLTGLGCFTLAVLPILGFTKITYLAYSPVADHLQYLGLPAVVALVCGGVGALLRELGELRRPAGLVLTILAAGICVTLTWRQAEIYHNEQTLWEANLAVGEGAWAPHAFLARYLQDNAEPSPEQDEVILGHLRRAVELAPDNPIPHEQLAEICRYLGFPLESRAHFAIAVDLVPEIARDHNPTQGPRSSTAEDTTRALAALRRALGKHPEFHYSRLALESLETPASAPATRRE